MKKYLIITFLTTASQAVFGQVSNDSCLSSIEIQQSFGENGISCFTGVTGFDASVSTSNANSIPNVPYPSMTNCKGYSNSTSTFANDIWFKLKTKGFIIYVYPGSNGLDTVHLNVWHGNNCFNLKPSGCFTFDLVTQFEQYNEFCGDTLNGEYTYLQFSGNDINKTGRFGFCIKGFPCANIWYYGTTGILNENGSSSFQVYPNPIINQAIISIPLQMNFTNISIYNSQGSLVKNSIIENSTCYLLDRDGLVGGLYFVIFSERKTGKKAWSRIILAN
ncbi:MAG: T9SS type A sorting domain-containing protein [Saprospiraceae bacterium]|nr:T9SS type A sorting domain-containing protein [Saprospiraceae bacterium]MBK9723238.1 T9SS type A sorting domain-containing protein [Saprospiraceae bacterium]